MTIKRIPFSPMTRNSCPYSLAGKLLGKIKFIYSISAFHTNSNEKSIFLSSQPVTVSFPSNVLSVTYLRSFEQMFKMYTIYKCSVQTLYSQHPISR